MRFGSWSVLCGVVWGLAVAAPARADETQPARWIGEDAAVYVEAIHTGQIVDRLLDDRFQKALRAFPPYAKALDSEQFAKLRQVVEAVAGKLDITWEQALRDLTGGGIALAAEGTPPRIVMIVTPKDPEVLRRASEAVRDLAREHAAAQGNPDPIVSAEYRGITGYGVGKAAYAIVEGRLVIADRSAALKQVVDRVLEGAKVEGSLAGNTIWKDRRERLGDDALGWGFARMDRLREIDPRRFDFREKGNVKPQVTLLFGSWLDAIRRADWVSASLSWPDARLGVELAIPASRDSYAAALRGFLPPAGKGQGAVVPLQVPGAVASLSLWRDLPAIWDARADLFAPEVVQGFAKLDGVAGQFFGGRDFGSGVLGALGHDWRLVVARQDYQALRPVPDVKLPAFALIADLKPDDDDDFAQRLKVAFQSFVGLANIGAAQSKAPPLELRSEDYEGVTITTTRYMLPKTTPDAKEPVHLRHNFSPSVVQVGNHFVLSSSLELTHQLILAFKAVPTRVDATLLVEADGRELAGILDLNKSRLVMQNMLEKGHDKAHAEEEIGLLLHLLRFLGQGTLSVLDGQDGVQLNARFDLAR